MTIETLLKVLRPFYQSWNAEGERWRRERWRLWAVPGKRMISVGIAPEGDAAYEPTDTEATIYEDGYWTIGIGPSGPTQQIATVRVGAGGNVTALEAYSTASYHWVKPMVEAMRAVDEIRGIWQ